MKAQWRLINIETGKTLAAMGDIFDVGELFEPEWQKQSKGTDKGIPIGILNYDSPETDKVEK